MRRSLRPAPAGESPALHGTLAAQAGQHLKWRGGTQRGYGLSQPSGRSPQTTTMSLSCPALGPRHARVPNWVAPGNDT